MSYSRAIQRQRERSRQNLQAETSNRWNAAVVRGQTHEKQASDVANKLAGFSKTLHDWKVEDIKTKQAEGLAQARKDRVADAEKIADLAEELKTTKEQDTRYQEIKQEMLRLGGPNAYPEADRLAGLSPWQQVGYAKEKLRAYNETFDDKLAHAMQNSEKAITISGVTFTPKQLRDNNITGLPFKEAAVKVLSEDIRKASNVDRFSPELIALAGTDEAMIKSQEGQMAKYRQRYNIDSSSNTRAKAQKEWNTSAKTGEDLYRLFLINSNTVDKNNALMGNAGGWDAVMNILTAEGTALGPEGLEYADKMGSKELPESLRIQLGAKKGTTFAQQWPGRFAKLKKDIKQGYTKATKAELDYQKAFGDELEAEFIEKARKGDLSTAEVNQWKRRFGEAGLPIPAGVTKYETASMRDEREDKEMIENIMAGNNGYISHEELDRYHPKAALEFREKATRMEKEALKAHDAPIKIKAHMDKVFINMGIKANEKSPAYVEAMSNAKADYAIQYNRYVAMGYNSAQASHLALHAKPGEVKDAEGNPISGSVGVITEIGANAENSKYVVTGQAIEKELKAGHLRVARIKSGKEEIRNDPNIINNGTIGGDYGHRQITSIKQNIEEYGYPKGLHMNKGAKQYYQGIARGRDGNWQGLIDSQLKAIRHPGLWPDQRPPEQDLFQGKDKDGNLVEDPNGLLPVAKALERAGKYPSLGCYLYSRNEIQDCTNYEKLPYSTWELPENRVPWLRTN